MKKILSLSLLLGLVLTISFSSCSDSGDDTPSIPVTSVTLSSQLVSIEPGLTITLTANILPSNASNKSIIWSSSNEKVATVTNGKVTAISPGTATITAKASDGSGKNASCTISVQQKISQISFKNQEVKLNYVGAKDTLILLTYPKDAELSGVKWKSSDESIVTVNNGIITGLKKGTAIVTASTSDGKLSAKCNITVFNNFNKLILPETIKVSVLDNKIHIPIKREPEDSEIINSVNIKINNNYGLNNNSWVISNYWYEGVTLTPYLPGTYTLTVESSGVTSNICTIIVEGIHEKTETINGVEYVDLGLSTKWPKEATEKSIAVSESNFLSLQSTLPTPNELKEFFNNVQKIFYSDDRTNSYYLLYFKKGTIKLKCNHINILTSEETAWTVQEYDYSAMNYRPHHYIGYEYGQLRLVPYSTHSSAPTYGNFIKTWEESKINANCAFEAFKIDKAAFTFGNEYYIIFKMR